MLSRVADCLYWMSRYLERAEHTARLLDVQHYQGLDQRAESAVRRWELLLAALRTPLSLPAVGEGDAGVPDAYGLTRALVFDPSNSSSIVACIGAARDNARQVREGISSEMWEQANKLYLRVKGSGMDEIWHAEPHEFFKAVREGAHLFQGITDATMSHGEGWHFIQLGRYIERAVATVALLDAYYAAHLAAGRGEGTALHYLEWVGLLKSCTAFEAYLKVYSADVRPERIAEFLLLDAEFPRSLRFMAVAVQEALQAIARVTGARPAGRADRLAGRLRAALDYSGIDEIMGEGGEAMRTYLDGIGRRCADIHTAVYQTYILQQRLDGSRRWVEEPGQSDDKGLDAEGTPAPVAAAAGPPAVQVQAALAGAYSEDQMQQQQG